MSPTFFLVAKASRTYCMDRFHSIKQGVVTALKQRLPAALEHERDGIYQPGNSH